MMIKKLIPILLMLIILVAPGCVASSNFGEISGVVAREDTLEKIPMAVITFEPIGADPTVPAIEVTADSEGRFTTPLHDGTYTTSISSSASGPFFVWPDPITIQANRSTLALFSIPEGF